MAANVGISALLEAEKEAAKIVQKAKQHREKRLKDARSEAAKDIEALKEEKNKEFQAFENEHAGESNENVNRVNAETAEKLTKIREAFAKNKQAVIDKMLETVITVKPQVHENAALRAR